MRTLPALLLSTSLLVACSTTRPIRAETPAAPPSQPALPPAEAPTEEPAAGETSGENAAEARSDSVVMNVQFDMVRRGAKSSTALSSEMSVDEHRGASFEHSNAGEFIQLNLSARPREDGDVLLFVHWRERAQDGELVEWSPTVLAKRGQPVTAKIDWGGGAGRSITLTVN